MSSGELGCKFPKRHHLKESRTVLSGAPTYNLSVELWSSTVQATIYAHMSVVPHNANTTGCFALPSLPTTRGGAPPCSKSRLTRAGAAVRPPAHHLGCPRREESERRRRRLSKSRVESPVVWVRDRLRSLYRRGWLQRGGGRGMWVTHASTFSLYPDCDEQHRQLISLLVRDNTRGLPAT